MVDAVTNSEGHKKMIPASGTKINSQSQESANNENLTNKPITLINSRLNMFEPKNKTQTTNSNTKNELLNRMQKGKTQDPPKLLPNLHTNPPEPTPLIGALHAHSVNLAPEKSQASPRHIESDKPLELDLHAHVQASLILDKKNVANNTMANRLKTVQPKNDNALSTGIKGKQPSEKIMGMASLLAGKYNPPPSKELKEVNEVLKPRLLLNDEDVQQLDDNRNEVSQTTPMITACPSEGGDISKKEVTKILLEKPMNRGGRKKISRPVFK